MKIYIQIPYYNKHITPIFDEVSKFDYVDMVVGLLRPGKEFRDGYDWDDEIKSDLYQKLWITKNKKVIEDSEVIGVHGFFYYFSNYFLVLNAIRKKKHILIFSEGLKTKSFINRLYKTFLVRTINSSRVHFFGIGFNSYEDYKLLGATKWNNVDFAYGVDVVKKLNIHNGPILKLIYVGQLINRKRPIDIISVVEKLNIKNIELHLYGSGDLKNEIVRKVDEARNNNIYYHGMLPKVKILDQMLKMDCLVLPSTYDGWGAVVNEAMECSLAVIVSEGVRSRSIISSKYVYPVGDLQKLTKIILELYRDRSKLDNIKIENKKNIKNLNPKSLAQLIVKTLT